MQTATASPSTRAYAGRHGVDIDRLAAEIGRSSIAREDIDRKIASSPTHLPERSSSALWQVDHAAWGPVREEPLSRIMQIGAANLTAAQQFIPAVTHHDRVAMDAVETARATMRAAALRKGVKLTALAFHVMALSRCLRAHPRFNASLTPDGKGLTVKDYVHIGIAVDTLEGLLVPVIRDADRKGLFDIAAEISDLASRAQVRKLRRDEMGGASMSITNLGGIGGTAFTPIVNPPELAIIGITRAEMTPIWNGSEFLPRLMAPLDLSYDHRAINGADAARFLNNYIALLADPRMLLL